MSKHKLTTLLVLLAAAGAASAQTVTVTTCYDDIDIDYWAGTIADLPGPDGKVSFPEALLATDNTPGHQTINFEIPPSEWWLSSIYPGQVLLQSMFSWSASDSVTIDGTTQTAFTGDTFPGGWEISLDGLQLYLGGDGSSITGFHDSNVWVSGSNSRIFGNTGGMYIVVYNGSGSVVSDASGEAQLTIPGGSSAPVTVYAQALYLDTTLLQLIGFTNAVGVEFLP